MSDAVELVTVRLSRDVAQSLLDRCPEPGSTMFPLSAEQIELRDGLRAALLAAFPESWPTHEDPR